jgi:hypothetical protein
MNKLLPADLRVIESDRVSLHGSLHARKRAYSENGSRVKA